MSFVPPASKFTSLCSTRQAYITYTESINLYGDIYCGDSETNHPTLGSCADQGYKYKHGNEPGRQIQWAGRWVYTVVVSRPRTPNQGINSVPAWSVSRSFPGWGSSASLPSAVGHVQPACAPRWVVGVCLSPGCPPAYARIVVCRGSGWGCGASGGCHVQASASVVAGQILVDSTAARCAQLRPPRAVTAGRESTLIRSRDTLRRCLSRRASKDAAAAQTSAPRSIRRRGLWSKCHAAATTPSGLGVRRFLAPTYPISLPHFRLYEVVSLHMCALPYK